MRSCVVTGASGLIGRRLLDQLEGWEVHCLAREAGTLESTPSVTVHRADLSSGDPLPPLPDRIDAVVHLAQSRRFREFPAAAEEVFAVNVASTLALLDYARQAGARTFVLASSGGVYRPRTDAITESGELRALPDLGFYLGTKLMSELLAAQYASMLAVVILRFFFVYGPRQHADMLLPRLIRTISAGGAVSLTGDDGLSLNPTFATDAAAATRGAMDLETSETINVGGPEAITLRRLSELIGREVGKDPRFSSAPGEPDSLVADVSKMTALFGAPRVAVREGVAALVGQLAPG